MHLKIINLHLQWFHLIMSIISKEHHYQDAPAATVCRHTDNYFSSVGLVPTSWPSKDQANRVAMTD
jgi:hypothetical protein